SASCRVCAVLNGLDCTAAQLRTAASTSQCTLARLLLAGSLRSAAWIVKLVRFAKTADAAHCSHALVPRPEAAVRGAAAAAGIARAPGIRVIGKRLALRPHRRQRRWKNERCQQNRRKTHEISPTMRSSRPHSHTQPGFLQQRFDFWDRQLLRV